MTLICQQAIFVSMTLDVQRIAFLNRRPKNETGPHGVIAATSE